MTPAYLSEPSVQYLIRTVDELRTGALLVPRFQRRALIWDTDDRLELMRSIRMGIPIGAIFVWRTKEMLHTYDRVGPVVLKRPPETSPRQYLLDGLQRLSCLLVALTPVDHQVTKAEADYVTYFDFAQDDFVLAPAAKPASPTWLPLPDIVDSIRLRKAHRLFPAEFADDWIEKSDAIAESFKEYKVPVIPLVGDDFDRAVETFQRINRPGAPMSYVHMANARTWTPHFSLNDALAEFRETGLADAQWSDLSDDAIVAACKVNLEIDLYEKNVGPLAEKLKTNPHVLQQSFRAVESAVHFLARRCSVFGQATLPYQHQLTLVAEALYRAQLQYGAVPPHLEDLLHSWFIATSVCETFRGISGYRFATVVDAMRGMVRSGTPSWPEDSRLERDELPDGSASWGPVRTRFLALQLARLQGDEAARMLAEHGRDGFCQAMPRKTLNDVSLFGWLGNRFVVNRSDLPGFTEQLKLSAFQSAPEFCRWHAVSPEALAYLRIADYDSFIAQRTFDLEVFERNNVAGHLERFRSMTG